MKTTFLGQGLESSSDNAVGYHLIKHLSATDFHSFTCISAFASEAGVSGLSRYIQTAKKNFKNLTFIVGVDQGGTSKEALFEILNLDINSYIFYQEEPPIFHPKIYLFEGDKQVILIVGSSNLTGSGLFTNAEGSVLIEFNADEVEGITLLAELKLYYKSLLDFTDPNLFKIDSTTILKFEANGVVPDEAMRRKSFTKKNTNSAITAPQSSGLIIPKRTTPKIPPFFQTKTPKIVTPKSIASTVTISSIETQTTATNAAAVIRTLAWQKNSLSRSDAQQVPSGTNPTGKIGLSQAKFKENGVVIDQTTYFRHQVFNGLIWVKTKPNSNTYEEVICPFDVTLLGSSIGVHNLKLTHDSVRIAGQGNTPTWLHWTNTIVPFLQQINIIGKTLNLYIANQRFYIDVV